jgi:plastocyanin
MQIPKKHLPIVGLLGLVFVAAAGGGIYYYQFVVSHAAPTLSGVHRLVFMNATIVEASPNNKGFWITETAFLNQSTVPSVDPIKGLNLTGVAHTDYKGNSDNSTVNANAGDTITFIIFSKSEPSPQYQGIPGHGFDITPTPDNVVGQLPGTLFFGKFYTVTFTLFTKGTYTYSCNIFCSPQHLSMKGNIVVG